MKKLALFALSVIATAAMAAGPTPPSEIVITGNSYQSVSLSNSGASNTANGADALAQQNLASNAGNVTIGGTSWQTVYGQSSHVSNWADSNAVAQQNLSSNVGDVTIGGFSSQSTSLYDSYVSNAAYGKGATAVQNIASNNACFACTTTGFKDHGGGNH